MVVCEFGPDDVVTFLLPAPTWREALAQVADWLARAGRDAERMVRFSVQEQSVD